MAAGVYDIRFIMSVTDRTGNSMRRIASDMRATGAEAKRMQRAFTAMDVGRGLALRGLLGGAAMGAAAQQAASFATNVTKAATQAADSADIGDIGQNTIKLQKEILDLMAQFPGSAQQQANAAYDIFSAMNVPLDKGVGLLKLFNMVAVAGATDLETATDAMITLLNNFGGSWKTNMAIVKQSFGIIRFGKMEFSEFNDMLQSVVPAAKGAGQNLRSVSGAMAFLSTRMKPNIAATALSRLLEVMGRADFRVGARKLGLELEDSAKRLKPFPEIISELARLPVAKIEGLVGQLIPMITAVGRGGDSRGIQSTIQARKALIALITQEQQYQKIQRLTVNATSEFEKRYVAMIGSAGVKWERFKSTLQALVITIGGMVIPIFEKWGAQLRSGIEWARQNRGMLEFMAKLVLITSALMLFTGIISKVYGSLLILRTVLVSVAGALTFGGMLGTALTSLGLLRTYGLQAFQAMTLLEGVLGVLAGLGIITVAILIIWQMKKWKGVQEFFKSIDEKLIDMGSGLGQYGPAGKALGSVLSWVGEVDRKVRIKNIKDIKKNAKSGPGSTSKLRQAMFEANNYDPLIADIKRRVGTLSKQFNNAKMMKALGLDPAAIQKQLEALLNPQKGDKDRKQMADQIVQRTKDLMQQAIDGLVNVYNEFKQANEAAFGSIFEPIEGEGEEAQLRKAWNWTGGANNLLNTMKARLAQFQQWRGMLTMLLKKGFSKEFVEEFKKMGPEGLKHIDELKKAGPKKVQEFNRVMGMGKGAIVKATEIDFAAQLAKWMKFGSETAFKIAAGMISAEPQVDAKMRGVVTRLWGGVAKQIATEQVKLETAIEGAMTQTAADISKLFALPVGAAKKAAKEIKGAYKGIYMIPVAPTGPGKGPVTGPGSPGPMAGTVYWPGLSPASMAPPPSAGAKPVPGQIVNIFQIDGTFMTPAELMAAALRAADNKTKNKR